MTWTPSPLPENDQFVPMSRLDIPRDSFARFDDYLCEAILAHLPPEDKIRLEVVSKQFQRTIFRQQKRLVISPNTPEWSNVKNAMLRRFVGDLNVKHRIDMKVFDNILSKFSFVEDVEIQYNLDTENIDDIFRSLMRHCRSIRRLNVNFFNVSEEVLDEFGKTFGHTLEVVKSSYVSNTKIPHSFALLKHCSNLVSLKSSELLDEQLWNNVYNTMVEEEDEDSGKSEVVVLPNLKSCHLKVTTEEGVNQLERFSEVYMNRLERIKVEMVDYIARSHYMINFIFPLGICKFRNLRECILKLKYNGGYDADFVWLNNGLDGIANDCRKIEHLGLDFIGHQDFFINHVLEALTCFKTLPRLSISVSMYNKGLTFPVMPMVKRLKLAYPRLYQCTHLKHLVQSFPNVSNVNLCWMYFFNDVLLNSLIGMKRLKVLKIGGLCPPDVTTNGLRTFLSTSPQIRTLRFDKKPKITPKTIEVLLDFALKRSNTYYQFDFCLHQCDPDERKAFDQFFTQNPMPCNLLIH